MIWLTSDLHLGHANIIKYTDRPFANSFEMDRVLIERWNDRVLPNDEVYILGDFTLLRGDMARHYLAQLAGKIYVLGNPWHHDKRWLGETDYGIMSQSGLVVEILPPMIVLEFSGYGEHPLAVTLCHYPLEKWDRSHHGALHAHGHIHGKKFVTAPNRFDVGVDANDFRPIALIDDIIASREL
jgi:calcineurin-like phosphoesterase family protein